ncbi:MAG: glucose-1-phosphate cytidylyltransferase [Lachnospiraceae bacterium]|nr:glucose-1-phosphate cytidylyltransferase [Lachnospiraceae bacterium]
MKTVILAGGFGTRISEESIYKPKPMVEIGGKPILWHIMKQYSAYGFNEFVICAGYKQHVIKEWFANYFLYNSDVRFNYSDGKGTMTVLKQHAEPWEVTVVDTGLNTMTGGRIGRIKDIVGDEPFFLTYGDGVSDVDLKRELEFHRAHKKYVTVTAYNAGQRFGILDIDDSGEIMDFREKTKGDGNMINVGFMICESAIFDYIDDDTSVLEKDTLQRIADDRQLMAYKHEGFWQCMDNIREKEMLEKMWSSGEAPWKIWKD